MNAGEQLQNHLERFFALRQHGDDALFLARLGRVQAFQRQRLMENAHSHSTSGNCWPLKEHLTSSRCTSSHSCSCSTLSMTTSRSWESNGKRCSAML